LQFTTRLSKNKLWRSYQISFLNLSENFPPRPHVHEVSRYRAVTGKKKGSGIYSHHKKHVIYYCPQ